MSLSHNLACLVASAAVLAACSKAPSADTAQAAAQAGASGDKIIAGSDTEMPDIKPGLWEITMSHTSGAGVGHGGVTQQCLDKATMDQSRKTAADYVKANCSRNETHRDGNTWTNDLACRSGGKSMVTHTVTALAGDGAYHTELTTTYDPPIAGQATSATTMDGKWIGDCKPT